jgi:hypothetical protein
LFLRDGMRIVHKHAAALADGGTHAEKEKR